MYYKEKDIKDLPIKGQDTVVIVMEDDIEYTHFLRYIEFLYTGLVPIKGKTDNVEGTIAIAKTFGNEQLVTYCENILNGLDELNPSIGTWLNDLVGEKAKEDFFNRTLFSDLCFKVENVLVHGHKAMVSSRCAVLEKVCHQKKNITSDGSTEIDGKQLLEVKDTKLEIFHAFLEYLYTAHAPIASVDSIALMSLAYRYGITRLVSLTELFISKMVERETETSITDAKIDVIGLLHLAQECEAKQLAAFCLHFVSANYIPMQKRKEFENLKGANKAYVEEHQWPPKSYLEELAKYEASQRGEGGAAGGDPKDKCLVM